MAYSPEKSFTFGPHTTSNTIASSQALPLALLSA